MNELLHSFIEDDSTEKNIPTAVPASSSMPAFQISAGYMYVIVAIYGIVVVLVIFIIMIIVIQSIRKSWRKKNNSGYGAILHQRADDLDTLDNNSRTYGPRRDDDSEYDNVSLNLGSGDREGSETDVPPLYENPPPYLSINR